MNLTSKIIPSAAVATVAALTLVTPTSAEPEPGSLPLPKYIVKKFDADKNGKLEGEEIKTLIAAVEANKKEIEAATLKRFDSNKDGKLDKKEARIAKKTIRKEQKEIKAAMLKKFDKDGDGKLKGKERKGTKEWLKETYPNAIPKVLLPPKFKIPTA